MSDPLYAIGDIHGQIELLEQALEWVRADGGPDAPIVFLGDLVDRGPDSRGVIDRLMEGQADGLPWQVLMGNHDRMFARFLSDGVVHDPRIKSGIGWLHPRLGGPATLLSYGVKGAERRPLEALVEEARELVPETHLGFLNGLPKYIEREGKLFVHAGLRPGVALSDQDPDDLLWIRDGFLEEKAPYPWLVVHGHTALDMPFHYGNRVNLDGGGGYGRTIYPAVFEDEDCWLLDEQGRLPLVP